MRRLLVPLAAALLAGTAAPATAHYNMLLPDKHSVKKGEAVTLTYQWGHPFEHQLFDAPAPDKLTVLSPRGAATDVTKALEKTTVPAAEGKKVTGYQLKFTPDQRGDFVFVLRTPPIWMAEEEEFFQDTVTVVLHVEAQKGWDGAAEDTSHLVPLTRPYGLQPGMVFQTRFNRLMEKEELGIESIKERRPQGGRPREGYKRVPPGLPVEVERYNPAPPKELPPDEHITRAVQTDPNAVATCTLTEPGWWSLTAHWDGGTREREGKKYPVRQRATLWVFVDEKR
jgi:cobalt/nickel transport protein